MAQVGSSINWDLLKWSHENNEQRLNEYFKDMSEHDMGLTINEIDEKSKGLHDLKQIYQDFRMDAMKNELDLRKMEIHRLKEALKLREVQTNVLTQMAEKYEQEKDQHKRIVNEMAREIQQLAGANANANAREVANDELNSPEKQVKNNCLAIKLDDAMLCVNEWIHEFILLQTHPSKTSKSRVDDLNRRADINLCSLYEEISSCKDMTDLQGVAQCIHKWRGELTRPGGLLKPCPVNTPIKLKERRLEVLLNCVDAIDTQVTQTLSVLQSKKSQGEDGYDRNDFEDEYDRDEDDNE